MFSRLRALVDRSLRVRNFQLCVLSSLLPLNTTIAPRCLVPPSSVFRQRGRMQCFVFYNNRNRKSSKNTRYICDFEARAYPMAAFAHAPSRQRGIRAENVKRPTPDRKYGAKATCQYASRPTPPIHVSSYHRLGRAPCAPNLARTSRKSHQS